jgi:hypothetical protein
MPMLHSPFAFSQKLRTRNAPPVEIADLEMGILHALHRYRLLEWRQIRALFASSVPNMEHLAERIELLYRNAYVEEVPRLLYSAEMERGKVYRLGGVGAQLLAGQLSIPFPAFQYWRKGDDQDRRKTQVSSLFLNHTIELIDIRIALERSAARNGCTFEMWQDEVTLQQGRNWPRVTVETTTGKEEHVPILPDTHFVLVSPQGRAHFFVEGDRSTESIARRWQRKILGYKAFVLSGDFNKHYDVAGFSTPLRILTTTPSLARSHNLKAAAEMYGPAEATPLFLFTPLSELVSHDALSAPIWLRAGSTDLQRIL